MKKVQFLGRFANKKRKTEEEKQEEQIDRLINPDKYERMEKEQMDVEIEFIYDPIVIDLENIAEHVKLDKAHTQLNMMNKGVYIVKIPFDYFNDLYQQEMGCAIKKVVFASEEAVPRKRKSQGLFDKTDSEPEFPFDLE